jgi:hypothetical protein
VCVCGGRAAEHCDDEAPDLGGDRETRARVRPRKPSPAKKSSATPPQ